MVLRVNLRPSHALGTQVSDTGVFKIRWHVPAVLGMIMLPLRVGLTEVVIIITNINNKKSN